MAASGHACDPRRARRQRAGDDAVRSCRRSGDRDDVGFGRRIGGRRVTSRIVGHATGALFIVIAFLPPVHNLLIAIPRPVMGAALLFSSCFINVSAMQVMTSRMMDAR